MRSLAIYIKKYQREIRVYGLAHNAASVLSYSY
jgi:hypothetical protein